VPKNLFYYHSARCLFARGVRAKIKVRSATKETQNKMKKTQKKSQ
jgi:hypothetical protein